jgi:hypothetical protein
METSSRYGWAAIASLLLMSSGARAATLSYAWKNGDVRRYRYEETTHFQRGGETVTLRSTFSQTVRAAHPDGTAEVELKLEQLELRLRDRSLAGLERLPARAAPLVAAVDRQGRLTLRRTLAVSLHGGRIYVGLRAGTAGTDRPRLEPFASLDPATGMLVEVGPSPSGGPAEGDPTVDAVPGRLFELLVLPRRVPAVGGSQGGSGPAGALHWSLATTEKSVATIRVTTGAAGDDAQARKRMVLATRASPVARREADLTMRFDRRAGQLLEARGTVIEQTPSKTNSRVTLELVPPPGDQRLRAGAPHRPSSAGRHP